jgi:hypothetical protein
LVWNVAPRPLILPTDAVHAVPVAGGFAKLVPVNAKELKTPTPTASATARARGTFRKRLVMTSLLTSLDGFDIRAFCEWVVSKRPSRTSGFLLVNTGHTVISVVHANATYR